MFPFFLIDGEVWTTIHPESGGLFKVKLTDLLAGKDVDGVPIIPAAVVEGVFVQPIHSKDEGQADA